MAKKAEPAKSKVVLERVYNVPLRREFQKVPIYKRTKKAVTALKQYIEKHMKSEDVRIGIHANQLLWKDGIKNPPHHIKVNAVKDDKGTVRVELVELTGRAKREEEKKAALEKAKEAKDKKQADEKKPAAPAPAKKEEAGKEKVVEAKAQVTDLEKAVESEAPKKEEKKAEEKPEGSAEQSVTKSAKSESKQAEQKPADKEEKPKEAEEKKAPAKEAKPADK